MLYPIVNRTKKKKKSSKEKSTGNKVLNVIKAWRESLIELKFQKCIMRIHFNTYILLINDFPLIFKSFCTVLKSSTR